MIRSQTSDKQKRAVYQTEIGNSDDTDYPQDEMYDSRNKAYHVEKDVSDILVNNSNSNCSDNNGKLINCRRHSFQDISGTNRHRNRKIV
jgi:hypothetical protein